MTAHNNRIAAKIKRLWQKGDIFKEKCRYYDRREFFECVFESKDPQILFSVHQGERKFVLEDRVFEELCITDARDFCDYVRFFQLMGGIIRAGAKVHVKDLVRLEQLFKVHLPDHQQEFHAKFGTVYLPAPI